MPLFLVRFKRAENVDRSHPAVPYDSTPVQYDQSTTIDNDLSV